MLRLLKDKIIEALKSVLPVVLIVYILSFTPLVSFSSSELLLFGASSIVLILGISLFNLGADLAMTPMGEYVGSGLTKTKNIPLLCSAVALMGILITVAEPDLTVLASQVEGVMSGTLLTVMVGVGVGLLLMVGMLRILFHKDLSQLLLFFYFALFAIAALLISSGKGSFLAVSFDSGGVTTGPITVPFLMALAVGISGTLGGRRAGENSFGMIALCSVGPILAVLALSLSATGSMTYTLADYSFASDATHAFFNTLREVSGEVAFSLVLITSAFMVLQIFILKLPRQKLRTIFTGILLTFCGLVMFLAAASFGFMPIGFKIGSSLADGGSNPIMIGFAFVLGAVVVLAEPAIHVLNKQVENVTAGAISGTSMMIALSIGVGLSIALSVIRIIFQFSLLFYLIPGYLLSLGLSFFVPKIYTAIAFDSGGVASGPLTSSFILPMVIGVCYTLRGESSVLDLAFGVVAMVAMIPLITIQLLGFRAVFAKFVHQKRFYRNLLAEDDEQIIYFSTKEGE